MGWTEQDYANFLARRKEDYEDYVARRKELQQCSRCAEAGVYFRDGAWYCEKHRVKKQGRIRNVAPVEQRTYNGRTYHSKAEAIKAAQLDVLVKVGAIASWTPQVPFPIVVNGVRICKVVVDFEIVHLDGSRELVETKGHETELYRLKRKLFAACYPLKLYTVEKV